MPRGTWPLPQVDDHNGEQWLTVKFCALLKGHPKGRGNLRRMLLHPGWYVVRTCPCHFGERVTMPYPTEARAEHARRFLLAITEARRDF